MNEAQGEPTKVLKKFGQEKKFLVEKKLRGFEVSSFDLLMDRRARSCQRQMKYQNVLFKDLDNREDIEPFGNFSRMLRKEEGD